MYTIVCEDVECGNLLYFPFEDLIEAKKFYRRYESSMDVLEIRTNEKNGYYDSIDLDEFLN